MTQTDGDVAARVAVRFDEALESLRLIRTSSTALPDGAIARAAAGGSASTGSGLGYVEGWRGPVLVALDERARTAPSAAAIRTIRRGRTGRCSSTR